MEKQNADVAGNAWLLRHRSMLVISPITSEFVDMNVSWRNFYRERNKAWKLEN